MPGMLLSLLSSGLSGQLGEVSPDSRRAAIAIVLLMLGGLLLTFGLLRIVGLRQGPQLGPHGEAGNSDNDTSAK
jgi:hypothetical protein